jgi:thiol-disulfide isomerase/thioredoxin
MKNKLNLFLLLLLGGLCTSGYAQDFLKVPSTWIDGMRRMPPSDSTLYVINFWATWCKPCVEELPVFEDLTKKYPKSKLKVILVSLDMKKEVDTKLPAFITEKKLQSEVMWMSDPNANLWINRVSPEWSGALPATWLVKKDIGFEYFKEGQFSKEEMDLLLNQIITP